MATDSKPKLILQALADLVGTMTRPDYHFYSDGRVYRGRRDFDWHDSEYFPVWSVFAYRSQVSNVSATGVYDFTMQAVIEAHAEPFDLDNPGDTATNMVGDLLRLIMSADTTLGGQCSVQLDETSQWNIELPEPGEIVVSSQLIFPIHYRGF